MKSLLITLLAGATAANPVFNDRLGFSNLLTKRQGQRGGSVPKGGAGGSGNSGIAALVGGLVNSGYGRVADPAGAAPRKVNIAARATNIPGSKTIKVRYGPYKVPNMSKKNIIGEEGALWNYPDKLVDKPCETCVIVGMNAGLEYPDGKNANIDNGMWLHHFVLFSVGPGRVDATCVQNRGSLPHMLIGSSPVGAERLFSSGNERTPAFLPQWSGAQNVGYHLKAADKFSFIVDLMNEKMNDEVVYLTITYDYIPGNPETFDDMKPVWFDAAQCGTSEVRAPKQNGSFVVSAPAWTANFNGDVLGSAGHLHDGGERVTLEVAGQGVVCDSQATYGGSPEYIQKEAMGGHSHSATKHISNMGVCKDESFKIRKLAKGQVWTLKAHYDYDKNPGMLHSDGKQATVMGIAIMYVRVKKGEQIEVAQPAPKAQGGAPPKGARNAWVNYSDLLEVTEHDVINDIM